MLLHGCTLWVSHILTHSLTRHAMMPPCTHRHLASSCPRVSLPQAAQHSTDRAATALNHLWGRIGDRMDYSSAILKRETAAHLLVVGVCVVVWHWWVTCARCLQQSNLDVEGAVGMHGECTVRCVVSVCGCVVTLCAVMGTVSCCCRAAACRT